MAYRIMFVDDELSMRDTLTQVLTLHGFEVTSSATVAEALSNIASRSFDVLVCDLNIDQTNDGFTVVSAMRRTQPDCITFILAGDFASETDLHSHRGQVDDYLMKPLPISELITAITEKLKL